MRRAALAFLALAALLVAAHPAAACSCRRNPTAAGILASAAAVFTATVVDSRALGGRASITTFRITEAFKGPAAGATVRVRHRNGSSARCGVNFTPGRSYTLAAHRRRDDAMLTTSFCSTWMFLPQVGLSKGLINTMRELRDRPRAGPGQ